MSIFNSSLFKQLKKEHDTYASARRELIGISNGVLSKSKQAIFALHRDDVKGSESLLKEVEKILDQIEKRFKKISGLRSEGSYKAALEEYVEARLFFNFLKNGKVGSIKGVPVSSDVYLGGLSDLTGELTRKAVQKAADGKVKDVEEFAHAIREVIGELIKFDLTGYLRTKYDQAKQNLRRIEDVLYDVKVRRK